MYSARKVVMRALTKLETENGYSNLVLDNALSESGLDPRDKAFASALFYGVLERRITLDYIISKYLRQPISSLSNAVLQALRIAVYQMIYMDKVPDRAAVNESVNLIKNSRQKSASGLVNAVLRSFLRDNKEFCLPDDKMKALSITYSAPQWLIKSFTADYGEKNAKGILESFFSSKPIAVRVNTTKISFGDYLKILLDSGIDAAADELAKNSILIKGAGSIENLPGYKEGYFHVQDTASQLCASVITQRNAKRVLDVCAAPGGKSFTIAENLGGKGEVVSCDLYPHKISLINAGKERLGLKNITVVLNDAAKYNNELGKFDAVLCDLPCSGLGILSKKPEIRYKNVAFLDNLPEIQYHLLDKSADYVSQDGLLVYSTCTLRHCENKDIADKFLVNHSEFKPLPIFSEIKRAFKESDNMLTLLPHIHGTDGFFISAFVKE
jgi:16S rRNA (cytosine967-C5)-methyltransferase